MSWCHDEETGIITIYNPSIEGVELNFNGSWCPGATISLNVRPCWPSSGRNLLYTMIDFPKVLHWMPPASQPRSSQGGVEMEYLEDGDTRREMLVTREEADERASQAMYDAHHEAHIAVTQTLSVGTSTVWLKVTRIQYYSSIIHLDVRFVVEFGNSEECTRFLHEHMWTLEHRFPADMSAGIAVIGDIMRALAPITDDLFTAERNATRRGIPFPQFVDDLPQPETQLICHRCSNRGDNRPCYLTLHISATMFTISNVDWSATTIPPTFPLRSDAFRSLNSLHLKFPSPVPQDRNHNSSAQFHQDDLTITISAREISFSTGTNTVSLGNGFTLSSEHRTVTVNYINAIMGDAFLGTINGANIGGRNNVNTIRISSPVGSRSPGLTWSLPRSRHTPLQCEQAESHSGVGRWVQQRSSCPRPY